MNLLRADVELEMPPIPTWFTGRAAVVGFLAHRVLRGPDQWRMPSPPAPTASPRSSPTSGRASGGYEAHGVTVLTLVGAQIARITAFNDPSLVPTFGGATPRCASP